MTSTAETVHQVAGAKVLWADYSTLSKYMALLGERGAARNRHELNQWLLDAFAYISTPHTVDNPVHDAPNLSGRKIAAFRPAHYGRTFVVQAGRVLFDVKGGGVSPGKVPEPKRYRTGLFRIHDAITELFAEKLVARIFAIENIVGTVPCLALIELPIRWRFDIGEDVYIPCGLLIRPHFRRHIYGGDALPRGSIDAEFQALYELTLRRYGLTSSWSENSISIERYQGALQCLWGQSQVPTGLRAAIERFCSAENTTLPLKIDIMNIQVCYRCHDNVPAMIDFEHIRALDSGGQYLGQITAEGDRFSIELFDNKRVSRPMLPQVEWLRFQDYDMSRFSRCKEQLYALRPVTFKGLRCWLRDVEHPRVRKLVSELLIFAGGRDSSIRSLARAGLTTADALDL